VLEPEWLNLQTLNLPPLTWAWNVFQVLLKTLNFTFLTMCSCLHEHIRPLHSSTPQFTTETSPHYEKEHDKTGCFQWSKLWC